MQPDLHREVLHRLKADYAFKERGTYLREGRCPACDKKELWTGVEKPWVLRCGRENRCGETFAVKELYPDLFDDWSKRYERTEERPHAAADAYLRNARRLDLTGLRGAFAQEHYRDEKLGIGSATVRFPLPGGGYWERLIDQPGRFGKKKARFSWGTKHAGNWWAHPDDTIEALAGATDLWIAEGIFDALSLRQAGRPAVSVMSCNNYPEAALAELRRFCADRGQHLPRLVFAFDVGAAGVRYTRKFVAMAREAGWKATAAQVRPDGEGNKLDWNDLLIRDQLGADQVAEYLWNGEVTIAATAAEKAFLIYDRHKSASFGLVFGSRQMWATFDLSAIEEQVAHLREKGEDDGLDMEELWRMASRRAGRVEEIANCAFRALYFQRDQATDESCYYLRVDFPSDRPAIKDTFSGASLAAGAEFKKRLISVAPGGIWTGTSIQLDRLMQRQLATIKSVEAIQFTGYSIEHKAYVLGDIAVHAGRVYERNDDDYFDFGRAGSVKLRSSERLIKVEYDPENMPAAWVEPLATAWGAKGLVVTAFWLASLFAEQLRDAQSSLAFLEITGLPGTGKSTLLEFLWRLLGRDNYEGFDPAKATAPAIARNLGKVANLPVVLIEGDRGQDSPHAKRFEWDELKTAYNGRSVRARGVANGGMETFEPAFRGAIVIAQNDPVEASPALRERIMALHFDKSGWNDRTKVAAETIERTPTDAVSGFLVHVLRREEQILKHYQERFSHHEKAMMTDPQVRNGRLAKNHAQLAGMLDCLALLPLRIPHASIAEAHQLIRTMLIERHRVVNSDHPFVDAFWERFDWLHGKRSDGAAEINHSRNNGMIAVSMPEFEQLCGNYRLQPIAPMRELQRALRTSKARRFIGTKTVNSANDRSVHCWVFEDTQRLSPATR
jgi:hypothetical protein